MDAKIKAVIFDMGRVLLDNRIEEILERVAKALGIDDNEFRKSQLGYHDDMIRGTLSVREFSGIMNKEYDLDMNADSIMEVWRRSYLEVMTVNKGLIDIVKKLKERGYKTGLISNVPDLHARINKDRHLFDPFDVCILSCEVGLIKPERPIFEKAASQLDLDPEECVFTDDREKYLVIPREMGFSAILFKNNDQLIKDLFEIGVELEGGD